MIILGYRFEPKLWAIVLTIVATSVFFKLGQWQLSRAHEKEMQYEQIAQYTKQPTVSLPGSKVKLEDFQYREVEVRGEFISEHTIYLDNKTYKGQAGYHIITPLKISNSTLHVAVNRGWIPTGNDRSILPSIPKIEDNVEIIGENQVWNNFNIQRYQEVTGLMMQPLMILQGNEENDGLIRSWTRPDSGGSKNIGYAVQWFSLAATTIIIFIVMNVKRKFKKNEQA
ncbi:MAG: SURF1 family protein [Nitrosomonas sp. PRO4]|nr:SURF1 family protein [Nitrosomonas sp. PRO4]